MDTLKDVETRPGPGAIRTALLVLLIAASVSGSSIAAAAILDPGDHGFTLEHQFRKRSYLARVPPHATAAAPLPVVLNFHGGAANAKNHKSYSRMDAVADREGFIAVYPNGSGGIGERFLTWNAGTCCGPAAATQADDVGFVLALLDDLARRTPVDRNRIYATGLSNGAMMAYRLAAEASERIAAVAPVAGAMTVVRFAPSRPVPVMHIHSVDDQRALYNGGLGPPFPLSGTRVLHPPVEEMLARWVRHNGCAPQPAIAAALRGGDGTRDQGQSARKFVYAPCRAGTEVVLWKLTGAGHVWPGGQRDYMKRLLGADTAIIDANSEMWRFFSRFTLSR
ncbi:MAG: prolyl oligopeptidase family serine peptidase [Betaproteobacteria bacterium]|nr:prolyl oligopeptidase family serine peptidase [Betaproteobacteria bacterium]